MKLIVRSTHGEKIRKIQKHFQNGCHILPIFKYFLDFNEIWYTWETWYPELNGDGEFFFRAIIFKMAAKFLPIF